MTHYGRGMQKAAYVLGMSPETFDHAADLAGLGVLAAVPAYHLYKHIRGTDKDTPTLDHAVDLAGLGVLAVPSAIRLMKHH